MMAQTRVVRDNMSLTRAETAREMCAVVPRHIFGMDEPQIRFVEQRRGMETVSSTLCCHAASRDLMKFPLYERNQSAEGGLVALTPFQKQCGNVRGVVRSVGILGAFWPVHRFPAQSRSTSRRSSVVVTGTSACVHPTVAYPR